jgi:enoyl-CoA hydratase
MAYQNIIVETENRIGIIEINRPKKLNALNQDTIEELHQAFDQLDKDSETRAIIITGSGEKAFVAGADISEFADFGPDKGRELSLQGQQKLFDFVENLGTPVIAAINGFALGGGLELAMACHIRVASNSARMGLPEVSLGLIPGYGGTQRLPQLVGKGKAFEMIMTAGMIGSADALKSGLVNHLTEPDDLIEFSYQLAEKILANSSQAIKAAIGAVNAGFKEGTDGFKKEIELFGSCFGTEDFEEGTTAFLEKRKPNF